MQEENKNYSRLFPRMTVGVMGSAGGHIPDDVMKRAYRLGQEIARRGNVLVTGACPGIPHESVKGAKNAGGFVVGVSPALNFKQHIVDYQSPTMGYDAIVYTGSGLMGREIENIRSCDVVIFAGGRSGTLGEFAIAYDESKVIGILLDTGGITEHLESIIPLLQKDTGSVVVYNPDPAELLDKLEKVYTEKLLPTYQELVTRYRPDGILGP
jgi:uncharacterized protein (TIGR00725 family)